MRKMFAWMLLGTLFLTAANCGSENITKEDNVSDGTQSVVDGQCQNDAECYPFFVDMGPAYWCVNPVCADHICHHFEYRTTPLSSIPNNCQKEYCDGYTAGINTVQDTLDRPADTPCIKYTCSEGNLVTTYTNTPPPNSYCTAYSCSGGKLMTSYIDTPPADPYCIDYYCQEGILAVNFVDTPPPSTNPCKTNTCSEGEVVTTNKADGKKCSTPVDGYAGQCYQGTCVPIDASEPFPSPGGTVAVPGPGTPVPTP